MPRILLVVDDLQLRETLSAFLVNEGFLVDIATDGQHALSMLRAGVPPDAMVLNVMMPNMSGWRFRTEQLTIPELARIPTVILTATGNVAHAAIDADQILPKPITPEQLLAALRRHLGEVSAPAE